MSLDGKVVTLAQAYFIASRACLDGDYRTALETCRSVLRVRPDHADARRLADDIVRLDLIGKGSSHPLPHNIQSSGYTRDRLLGFHHYDIGEWSYGVPVISYMDGVTRLIIGRYCSIAADVNILLAGEHATDRVSTYPFPQLPEVWPEAGEARISLSRGDVVIGNDVWLGTRCCILSGVRIGDGAVIGAEAVVAKDIPPYAVAVGNPARVIRRRFPEADIERLLALRWWDWDDARVRRHMKLICAGDVGALVEAAARDRG